MYTRWRLYILAVFLIVIAACILFLYLLNRKKKEKIGAFRSILFVLGVVLVTETIIVSGLSNYNLGVILPAFFGVPMIALAFLLPYMKKGFLKVLKWITAGCYAAAAVIFIVCGILMLSAQHSAKDVDADAVITLGAAVHGEKVTWVLENRLNTTKEYLDSHPSSVCVVSGGMGSGESVTEASAMQKYLLNLGMDESRIYMDEKASNTVENFQYSKKIIDEKFGPDAKIAFVTTDFHVYRASRVAAAQGISAVGISAPDVWYLRLNNFMRECVGICVYALRGSF